jgi:hypothetical protein
MKEENFVLSAGGQARVFSIILISHVNGKVLAEYIAGSFKPGS